MLLMLMSFIFLILKRKKISKGATYIIAAFGISTGIEIYCNLQRHYTEKFNSSIIYVVGINLVVFLLFFLYFQNILVSKKLKRINIVIIVLFLLNYSISALSLIHI